MLGAVAHHYPEVQQAGVIPALIVAVGFALLSRLLFKPKEPNQVVRDDKPNTAHLRGSFIPLVLGTRRVGAVILDVWGRETEVEEEEVGGKGGGGGGGAITKTIYYEKAVHALCVGPIARIKGIWWDGELLPGSENLNKLEHPSGTSITFANYGTARIYWGESDQPVDSAVAGRLGINTRLPFVAYIVWDRARLGGTPRWKIVEYVVDNPGGSTIGPVASPEVNGGVNPAQIFWQITTAAYPHGAGLPTDWVSFAAVTAMGGLAVNEQIGMNILVQDGDPVDRILSEMMQDFGFLLTECNGVIAPYAIRQETESVQLLDDTMLLPPIEEIENVHLPPLGNGLVYEYNDAAQNYHAATIDVDDDTIAAIRNQRRTKKIRLTTVTSRNVASKIVNRRQIEDLDNSTRVKIKGLRGLRATRPGQAFDLPGVGRVRALGFKLDFNSPEVEIELLRDPFNQEITDVEDPDLPGQPVPGDLEDHLRFGVFELPYMATGGTSLALVALHHRFNASIFQSNVWVSADNVTYQQSGVQAQACTGGLLAVDWGAQENNKAVVEEGPLVTIDENGDENSVPLNLSGDYTGWINGSQYMVINDELMFVREFVFVSGTTWQARGVIRMRLNTGNKVASSATWNGAPRHTAGAAVFLIPSSLVSPQTHPTISAGGARYVKAQAVNEQGALPLAAIQPSDKPMTLRGTNPPPFPWFAGGGNYGYHETNGGGRTDMTWMEDGSNTSGEYDEDLVIQVCKPAQSGGAGAMGAGVPTEIVEYDDAACFLDIEVYYESTAGTYDELDLLGQDALVHSKSIAFTAADKQAARYRFTAITRSEWESDPDFSGVFNVGDETQIGSPELRRPWKILLYFRVNSLRSEPVELRLAYRDDNDAFGYRR